MSGYELGAGAIRTIQAYHRKIDLLEREVDRLRLLIRGERRPIYRRAALAKTGGTAITARSGTTPGSGTVTLYHLDGGSITAVVDLDSSPVTVTAYSFAGTASGIGAYIFIEQDDDGTWWYVSEDC